MSAPQVHVKTAMMDTHGVSRKRFQITTLLVSLGIVLFIAGCGAGASSSVNSPIEAMDPWARSGDQGFNSAAYMILRNDSMNDVTLVGASGEVANKVEIHETTVDHSQMMRMQQVEMISVPSASEVELKPKGLHVMLIDLRQDLKPGDQFTITLHFEELGNLEVEVVVRES